MFIVVVVEVAVVLAAATAVEDMIKKSRIGEHKINAIVAYT